MTSFNPFAATPESQDTEDVTEEPKEWQREDPHEHLADEWKPEPVPEPEEDE